MCGNALEGIGDSVQKGLDGITGTYDRVANDETFRNTSNAAAAVIVGGAVAYGGAIAAGAAGGSAAGGAAAAEGGTAAAGTYGAAAGEGFAAGVAGETAGAAATGVTAGEGVSVLGGLRTAAQYATTARSLSNAIDPPKPPLRPGPAYNGVLPVQYVPAQASGLKGRTADPSPVFAGDRGGAGPSSAELIALAIAIAGGYYLIH